MSVARAGLAPLIVFVALGGLHVTSLPEEAAWHADTVFLGPGEQTFPAFLADFVAEARAPDMRLLRGAVLIVCPR